MIKAEKKYTCWMGDKNKKQQIMAEGFATSAKDFKRKIENRGNTVCSRIRLK